MSKTEVEESSGNVYADLGYPDAEEMLVKAQLAMNIGKIMKRRQLTLMKAAKMMGLTQAKVSDMLRGRFRGISEARMLAPGNDVEIRVKPIRRGRAVGKINMVYAAKAIATALVIAAAWPFGQVQAEDLQDTVTHVRDGDTIEVGNLPIRLNGLHAPELDDPGGKRAAAFMRDLVLHKAVTCSLTGEKTYDRFVGVCWLDGADIAGELVAAGFGRDCPRYSGGRYAALELDSAKSMPLPDYCEPR